MSGTSVTISLDDDRRVYLPSDTLAGQVRVEAIDHREVSGVEISVLWYTEGKGEEDLAVHFFESYDLADGAAIDVLRPRRFSTRLPNSPLSYTGVILKIRWCVRARVFLGRDKSLVTEKRFQMGVVPEGCPVDAPAGDSEKEKAPGRAMRIREDREPEE